MTAGPPGDDMGNEGADDEPRPAPFLHPDDRLWRHPSELGATRPLPAVPPMVVVPRPRRLRRALTLAAAGVAGAAVTVGAVAAGGGFGRHTVTEPVVRQTDPVPAAFAAQPSVADLVEQTRNSVVAVTAGSEQGTGIIYRSDGVVLTSKRLIESATRAPVVTTPQGRELKATVLGQDPDTDVAVLKVDGTGYTPATMGTSAQVEVGQQAVTIGAPTRIGESMSVTLSSISVTGATIDTGPGPALLGVFRTDHQLAAGGAGGPVLDANGGVIAMTTTAGSDDRGFTWAVPIDVARPVVDQLVTKGKVAHAWLGCEARGKNLDKARAEALQVGGGAVLTGAPTPASPAALAGMREGDVVTAVDGAAVTSWNGLLLALRPHKPGDAVTITVFRAGTRQDLRLALADRPMARTS